VSDAAEDTDTIAIDFSSSSSAAGYSFIGEGADIAIQGATWDFDGNGDVDALTDGLLLIRYAFGLRGEMLTNGVSATDSPLSSAEIEAAITDAQSIADIDDNGVVDPLSDGLLLLRHLFGFTGDDLVRGVVDLNGGRTSAEAITSYMDGYMIAQ